MGERTYRTVLIGSGNVATHLGRALEAAGHELVRVGGRTRLFPIPKDADLYVIAVTDSAIASVAEEIGDVGGLVVHTAGSVPMDILPQKRRGVLYPLQTFSKEREVSFRDIPLFIESKTDVEMLRSVAQQLSTKVGEMDSERRRYLHLAAVFCCNFVNRMYGITADMLREHDIPFDVMLPLIDETAAKVHRLSPHDAQTGPAVRWNVEVMEKQIALLQDDDLKLIYRLISKNIHNDKLRLDEDKGVGI